LGALIYRPEITASDSVDRLVDLNQLRKKVIGIYDDYSFDDIEEIFKLGASSGGARPKVNL
jgi:serine/threonine-protein kinase HipA